MKKSVFTKPVWILHGPWRSKNGHWNRRRSFYAINGMMTLRGPSWKIDDTQESGIKLSRPISWNMMNNRSRHLHGRLPMAQPTDTIALRWGGHGIHTVLADCNAGLLVCVGHRGGGGYAPSGSERGGCSSEHSAPPCPFIVAAGLQQKGGKGQTDHPGGSHLGFLR